MASHAHSTAPADPSAPAPREGYDFAHPLPVWGLVAVFFALTILTVITVAQANLNLGNLDIVFAMVIATVKAILVMMFFMHLAFDKPFHLFVFLSSFVFMALFVILTIGDARENAGKLEQVYDEPPVISTN